MRHLALLVTLAGLSTTPLMAQHEHGATDSTRSPYVELTGRDIKALGEEDVAALLAGDGMGLALAGELNRYPGPRHVLELAHDLGLEHGTVEQIQAIRDSMLARATALGRHIVDAERRLDRAFRKRRLGDADLRSVTAEIARLEGELRYVHLRAHLQVTALLTPEQVDRYEALRGYRRDG